MKFPIFEISSVYHVGEFKTPLTMSTSFEGQHLSVSLCPQAWNQIVKLGGLPTHLLEKTISGKFLDMLSLTKSNDLYITQWAVENRFLLPANLWKVYRDDDELGCEVFMEFDNYEDALYENDDDEARIETSSSFIATDLLLESIGYVKKATGQFSKDLAIMLWAQENNFDGVWWTENYNPSNYSAPRGCIFQNKVSSWKVSLKKDFSSDIQLLATMKKSQNFLLK